jgi:hypothetical protein
MLFCYMELRNDWPGGGGGRGGSTGGGATTGQFTAGMV